MTYFGTNSLHEDPGVKSRMCPPYPQRVVKGDWMGRFLEITVWKGWLRVGVKTGTLKNSTKWHGEPDRRSNFIPPAHLCAVTYMTEILLFVTLNNKFTSPHRKLLYYKDISPKCNTTNCIYFEYNIFCWNLGVWGSKIYKIGDVKVVIRHVSKKWKRQG